MMKPAKFFCALALLLSFSLGASGQTPESYPFTPNTAIPDNSTVGVTDSHVIASAITSITNITVSLQITGGFNGDYYAYLVHDSGFSILLNRIGRTSSNDFGNSGSGINVTFDDSALNGDIHLAPNGSLTGDWQPDARNVNPNSALDTSPRTEFLASFNGLDASGTWTLFVSDGSPVSTGTLTSWVLNITGVAIPEPASVALLIVGGGAILYWRKRSAG